MLELKITWVHRTCWRK